MTNTFDAGQAAVNLRLNTGDVVKDLKALENLFQFSGLKAGQLFGSNTQKGFKATLDPKPIGEGFRKNFIEGVAAKEAGKTVGGSLAKSIGTQLRNSLIKGGIGLLIDGLAIGAQLLYRAATKGARQAKERQEEYNRTLDRFKQTQADANQISSKYAGILGKNVNLMSAARGEINLATGDIDRMIDALNRASDAAFDDIIVRIEVDLPELEAGLAEAEKQLERARRRFNLSQSLSSVGGIRSFEETPDGKESLSAVDNARTKLSEAQSEISDAKAERERVRKFNEFRVQAAREVFRLENDLRKAIDSGNTSLEKSIREKIELKKLTGDILRLEDLRFTDNGIELTTQEQIGEAKRRAKILLDEFKLAKQQGELSAAAEQKRNQQLDEAKRLFEESRTPVERYRAELERLQEIKLDPQRLDLIGGKEGLERQLAQDLIELASRTKDFSLATAELNARIAEKNISLERAKTLTKELADASGRTGKIQSARSFKQSAATPLEALRSELDAINAKEAELIGDSELFAAAGGDITFIRNRVAAIKDFASQSGETETAIAALVQEFNAGRITAEAFGQSFQDITDGTESAGAALQRLGGLSGSITPDGIVAAEQAIKNSVDYQQDLNDEKLRELEIDLVRAQSTGDKDEIVDLENQIRLLERKNGLKGLGLTEQEASDLAPELIKNEELAELQGRVKNTFSGAFRAAMNGNFDGFLQSKLQNAAANMFDQALDSLLNSLFSALGNLNLGGGTGGQAGGLFGGLASIFAGLFADGGTIPRGQFGIVGEAGPELAFAGSAPVSIVPFDPVTPGRRSVADLSSGGRVNNSSVVMNIQTPDARSFRKSQATIESDMALAQRRASRDL